MIHLDLSLFSKYRMQLMGIATIMIILCHSVPYGVVLHPFIRYVFSLCNMGVDVFLFLSGMGCCYSLMGGVNLSKWYKKRYLRLLAPYTVIYVFVFLFWTCSGMEFFTEGLSEFLTISYWTHHKGAWFIALLIPLYFVTPFIYKLLLSEKYRYIISLISVVLILILTRQSFEDKNDIIFNIKGAFQHSIVYIIGMSIAFDIKREKSINCFWVVILPFMIYGAEKLIHTGVYTNWCLAIPISSVIVFLIRESHCSSLNVLLCWVGAISLESYLLNINLIRIISYLSMPYSECILLYGKYLEYVLVILLGISISKCVSILSKQIIKRVL